MLLNGAEDVAAGDIVVPANAVVETDVESVVVVGAAAVVIAPPILPHDTAGLEGVGSASVCTVTESLAAMAGPIVQPTSVTVTAVPAASGAVPPTVNTMDRAPGCAGVSVAPAVDTLAVGVAEVAK